MVDRLSQKELAAAADGFEYLGRRDLASLMREAAALGISIGSDREFEHLQQRYDEALPGDRSLEELFRRRLTKQPQDFAPVS
jgi:hypothetical protein